MKTKIFRFLKDYSTDPFKVDRLIISAYILINQLPLVRNRFLLNYLIKENSLEEFNSLNKFIDVIQDELEEFDIEDLIELFEFVVSPSDRVINGAIYTPLHVRDYIIEQALNTNETPIRLKKIADISCGCGGFLFTAAQKLRKRTGRSYFTIFRDQIFGLDIQDYSITRTKLLLSILALTEGEDRVRFHFNLHQGDTLVFNWNAFYDDFAGFDIIVGNPPYVCARNLDDAVKENLQNWSVCRTGNPDLYIPFFQIGFESLSENGILGYITMNTFFKSLNGRALREYFNQNNAAIKIIDFGTQQIFRSKSTYTCICFITNTQQEFIQYYRSVNKEFPLNENSYNNIEYADLDSHKGWNLNDHEIITKIESIGTAFGDLFKTRHGIATLRNDIFIFKPVKEDKDYYYLQNGDLYPIEKGICKDIINSNKLSREIDFELVKEKVIFPYNDGDKPKLITESTLMKKYPQAHHYLHSKREFLDKRDKGKGKYENWFAFGRTQSLEKVRNKLFFPKMSDIIPSYIINSDEDLLFYNGQAIIGHSEEEMLLVKKIMESSIFWYYIKTTSKPYSSSYYSMNGNYIRNFGICELSDKERKYVLNEDNQEKLDKFFENKYDIKLGKKALKKKEKELV